MANAKEEKTSNIFESIEFIFRHPLLFISPIVIIMSVVFAQLSEVRLVYKSSTLLTFETKEGAEITRTRANFLAPRKIELFMDKFFKHSGTEDIAKGVWPDLDKKKDPKKYKDAYAKTRRFKFKYNEKNNTLAIFYKSYNPTLCYKMIHSAIDALRKEIKRSTKSRIDTGLSFLKKQETYYRDKIRNIDQEISKIKSELKTKEADLSDEERILISEITGERDIAIKDQTRLRKLAKYDELLAELPLKLLEAKKHKQILEKAIATEEYVLPAKNPEDDRYVRQYTKQISDSELAITTLELRGYLPEHPDIKKLQRNIKSLKVLREKRIASLEEYVSGERGDRIEEAEKKAKTDLKKVNMEIETLEDKVKLLKEKYAEASGVGVKEPASLSILATRLKELRGEKEISQRYYQEIRRHLGEAELRSRVEESEAGITVVVINRPYTPSNPIPFQKTPKVVWGLVISLFLGSGLAYGVDSLDNSIKSATELREFLHTPILGSIDRIYTQREVQLNTLRRNSVIIALIVFALSAKLLVHLKLFQAIFGFLK